MGCGSGSDDAAAAAPPTTVPFDPDVPWWLQGGFAPVAEEVESTRLEVVGALPPELTGLYVRNGSNPRTGVSPHWFLGDGMVHGIRLDGGRARLVPNRYVRTPLYEASSGFGEGVPGGEASQSNVSAIRHGGKLLTSGEVGFPYELSPDDLSTMGVYDFGGRLTTSMTAHPKIDPATGQMHFFGYGFVPPYLTYHVADADGTLVSSTEVPVPGPTMIHDFAITEPDAVFWDLPVVFDLEAAVAMIEDPTGDVFPFRWDPSYGARIGVLPLGAAGRRCGGPRSSPATCSTASTRSGRGATSWSTCAGSTRCSRAGCSAAGWRCTAGRSTPTRAGPARSWWTSAPTWSCRRATPGVPGASTATATSCRTGRPRTRSTSAASSSTTSAPASGRCGSRGPTEHGGEWLFVDDAGGDADDEGWLLSYVHDEATGDSRFVVLDATDVAAGPVASVALPQRVPYGFHGTWIPDAG